MRQALGKQFMDWFLAEKRELEVKAFSELEMTEEEKLTKERELYLKFF